MEPFSPDDYRSLRDSAGYLDRSERGRIAALGTDRLSYLHAMLTNEIASLATGEGCYAAYLTPQGRMMADMRVLELGDLALLDVEACAKQVVVEKLEQFIFSEDIRLVDLTPQLAEIGVYGPRSADMVAEAVGANPGVEALAALAEYRSLRGSFGGGTAVIAADRDLGVPGFSVYVDRERAEAFADALRQAGARQVPEAAAEVLRVEAGRPRFGVDMDETTIPLEAGIEHRAISFTKGCYPGQEVITRVLHRGHGRVARKLEGLVAEGEIVPAPGDRVVADDREIGAVTSAVISPSAGAPIALGYLHRDFLMPGTAVSIVHDDRRVNARVTALPFVSPAATSRPSIPGRADG